MITQQHELQVTDIITSTFMKLLGKSVEVQVVFRNDMRTTAAFAYRGIDKIEINTKLFLRNVQEFLTTTIPHEVRHLVQHYLYPNAKQAHGPEFRKLMKLIGLAGDTYHSYDTTEYFVYKCSCQKFKLDKTLHDKIVAGKKICCKKCTTQISIV